jgi:hypothetical protein
MILMFTVQTYQDGCAASSVRLGVLHWLTLAVVYSGQPFHSSVRHQARVSPPVGPLGWLSREAVRHREEAIPMKKNVIKFILALLCGYIAYMLLT